jgi:UDP-glucuronate decarboxylase
MRYLVTGAAGFLGSHLSESLLQDGHSVVGLDDFTTGSRLHVNSLKQHKRFEFIEQDVREAIDVDCDIILNFACPASPVHYQADPVKTLETSVLGIRNLLNLARKSGATVLQASTSEIYGDPEVNPQVETYWGNVNPIGVRSCYDEGKRVAETLCTDYRRQFGVDARLVRIFNTYGPNMAVGDGRVVSNFIVQALLGKPITIYGTGQQNRAFCFVSDLVKGIRIMCNPDIEVPGPVNLGNPNVFTMSELAELVIRLTGSQSEIIYLELPGDDPKKRQPDISRARADFGWEPVVDLQEGLSLTIDYFRKILIG